MHILESYALNTANKISDPFIYEDFFPLGVDKYITLDNYPSEDSRDYKYWKDVVHTIVPELKKLGISIVQLCKNSENEIQECYSVTSSTSLNQDAYIIKNSLLHIGVDNINSEFAAHYGIDQICLIAAVHQSTSKPFWGGESCTCISPETKSKPTYVLNEEPRTINFIKPETIINQILKYLNIPDVYEFKTLSIGRVYPKKNIHFICNTPVLNYDLSKITPDDDLKVRIDSENPDTSIFMDFLSRINHKEICVVTNRVFQPEQLLPFKNKIKIIYLIDKDHNPSFVSKLRQLGFRYELTSRLPEEEINSMKLEYMDLGLIHLQKDETFENVKKDRESYSGIVNYKSSKFIMSAGKIFPSEYAMSLKEGSSDWGEGKVHEAVDVNNDSILSNLFWKDSKYFNILKKKIDQT